jgi:hypothetical protein
MFKLREENNVEKKIKFIQSKRPNNNDENEIENYLLEEACTQPKNFTQSLF